MNRNVLIIASLLLLLMAVFGFSQVAGRVYADDSNQAVTGDAAPTAVTRYITLNVRHFHSGLFGSDPSFTFKSDSGAVYYATGVSFPQDGTLRMLRMYGKFLHSTASDAEKVFVRLYSIDQDARTLLATVKSNYNASNLNFRWILSSQNTAVFANRPYYVTVFMPAVGAGEYEISSVRIEYETVSP
jgi:hypothetical protein